MAHQEIKKMKQGMSYSCKEKTIILNVFKYFRLQFPDKCITEIVRRTAKATGCSEKSIFQFRKEEASAEGFKVPSTTKIRRNININSRDIKYDNTVRQAIRNVIYDLKYKNIVPSLNTILKHVNGNASLPNFSLMTLRRLMFDMGFCYEKNGNKSILIEKAPTALKKEGRKENKTGSVRKATKTQSENVRVQPQATLTVPVQNNVETVKTIPQMPQNNIPIPQPHQALPQQNHRLLPMHMAQHESTHMIHNMHMPHHNMPMMLNHRMPTHPPVGPHNMNMHLKHEITSWHHPSPYSEARIT